MIDTNHGHINPNDEIIRLSKTHKMVLKIIYSSLLKK